MTDQQNDSTMDDMLTKDERDEAIQKLRKLPWFLFHVPG